VGGEWECRIRDQGPGIPAGHLPLIFERFYRADASRDRRGNQAGLGLAIARALLVAQGGRISAECPADGGTLLRFALPVLTPAPQSPPI
jgi:signal transduction histidine kinase